MRNLPSPHGDKLQALLLNDKLPREDLPRVKEAFERYREWLQELRDVDGTYEAIVERMVSLLNAYKRYVEVNLIFDSEQDFLYRQKGQLKLESTIIEEFLPILVTTALRGYFRDDDLVFGPTTCLSGIRFESSIPEPRPGGGMRLQEKDHDFAISRRLFIRTSYRGDFQECETAETHLAYVVAECKTNLDKTMFQEAAATALNVKTTVPGAKYYLLCEWLDMTPINTSTTAIDEVLILRKAKRLSAAIRAQFNTRAGRQNNRRLFVEFLESHPLRPDTFARFLAHLRDAVGISGEDEVLTRGYF